MEGYFAGCEANPLTLKGPSVVCSDEYYLIFHICENELKNNKRSKTTLPDHFTAYMCIEFRMVVKFFQSRIVSIGQFEHFGFVLVTVAVIV